MWRAKRSRASAALPGGGSHGIVTAPPSLEKGYARPDGRARMARKITTLAVLAGLVLTIDLPIYPEGMEPLIGVFLGLAALGWLFGMTDRRSRFELVIMAPWAAALLLAFLVGSLNNGESQQALEDALPYGLFMLGLVGGRGAGEPRRLLRVAFWVCVADTAVSLWLMDSFAAGVRSSYNYYKITAGLPIVGIYLGRVLHVTNTSPRTLLASGLHIGLIAFLAAGVVFSITRGMMLGALLSLAVAEYVRRPSQAILGSTVLLLGLLAYSSAFAEFGVEYLRLGQESTIEGRFREIESAWEGFVSSPLFGQGLGSLVQADGWKKAFVHNVLAYHLWKFGLVGSCLLVLPLFAIARELRSTSRILRGLALGAGLGCFAYLVTCAGYKTYYLVWIYGVVIGASLSYFEELREVASPRTPRAMPGGSNGA